MPGLLIILRQLFAYLCRGGANDGILAGIVIRGPPEYFNAKSPFLQRCAISCKSVLRDVAQ